MVPIKPRSILQLTVAGFLSVTGLLFIALLITSRQLDGLSEQNVEVLNESVAALDLSNSLIELTSSLDRNARQYRVLEDQEILTLYENRKELLKDASNRLRQLPLNNEAADLIDTLLVIEAQAASYMTDSSENEIESAYSDLSMIANRIGDSITLWSRERVKAISEETQAAQQMITLQGVILVIAALFLAGIFTALITRPLLQIERAISRLGSGGYQEEISISGPKDLVDLGKRLDWLRDRLNALESQRSSFLRHVSHELKTPLAAIRESASLLEDGIVGEISAKQKDVLDIQIKNTNRLQSLIDQLLRHHLDSFSVINSMPQRIDLQRLIEEIVATHEITIRTCAIEVETQLDPLVIEANREQLRVVLDNLLGNAIKYSPHGGKISITLINSDAGIRIEVADSGPGISTEHAEHIFEAFYQGPAPESELYQGNGLGLAIAKEYIERNGGDISLVSGHNGARFRIDLPGEKQVEAD